ncbi:MAG TPA: hypothetical protein PLZ62_00280 [bacterium]|nr:hypothetical protein [bacterium]
MKYKNPEFREKNGKIIVIVHDSRSGHDGIANGGRYGMVAWLNIKEKEKGSFVIVSDNDNRSTVCGTTGFDRTTTVELDPEKIEWACIEESSTHQAGRGARRDTTEYIEIGNIPGGPLMEKQKFFREYKMWMKSNVYNAIGWLVDIAWRLGIGYQVEDDVEYAQRKSSKGNINEAWKDLASTFQVEVEWPYSWTGVSTAPVKIALAVQKKHQFKGKDAFRWEGQRPFFPKEESGDYVTLPKLCY